MKIQASATCWFQQVCVDGAAHRACDGLFVASNTFLQAADAEHQHLTVGRCRQRHGDGTGIGKQTFVCDGIAALFRRLLQRTEARLNSDRRQLFGFVLMLVGLVRNTPIAQGRRFGFFALGWRDDRRNGDVGIGARRL